jgi:nucleotide-binding universal stress UspA family protein
LGFSTNQERAMRFRNEAERPATASPPHAGPIRSLLVHVDAGAHALARLEAADLLARALGARLNALHAVRPSFVGSLPIPDGVDEERHRLALLRFERFAHEKGANAEWLSSLGDHSIERFQHVARLTDLVVLGQRDAADADASDVPSDFIPRTILHSGTPALMLPCHPTAPFGLPSTVVVGWSDKPEAARALKAALPILAHTRATVHLASYGGAPDEVRHQHQHAASFMALHGVKDVRFHHAESDDAGESLLSLCRLLAANWLVMGCYGHGRAAEFLLGGTTFRVLHEATLPVLLAH